MYWCAVAGFAYLTAVLVQLCPELSALPPRHPGHMTAYSRGIQPSTQSAEALRVNRARAQIFGAETKRSTMTEIAGTTDHLAFPRSPVRRFWRPGAPITGIRGHCWQRAPA